MTRDEAIEIEKRKLAIMTYGPNFTEAIAKANIDALIELGLLKVEEPKNPSSILAEEFGVTDKYITSALDRLGLKVVKVK